MTVPRFTNAMRRPVGTVTPQPHTQDTLRIPSPIGMNTMTQLENIPDTDCLYTYNMLPYELGLQSRLGYRSWAEGFTPAGSGIRTVIPFNGNVSTNDRLFAATDQGIYRVDQQTTTVGAAEITWPTTGSTAGYVVWAHFTNDAGAHFLLAADEQNGLYVYTESTGTWAAATGITGITASDIIFVMSHKQRLWFILKDGSTWYMPVNAIAGAATRFNVAANFREGGNAVGLYSWTVDGGDGVDDYFVAVSREGGVVIYRGNDPANAGTWGLVGVWYIGRLPAGQRAGSQYGGQLFILSEHGLININRLIEGATIQDASNVSTDKITRVVREDIVQNLTQRGWEIKQNPTENHFYILSPDNGNQPRIQYVRNMTTNGWGIQRGMPMHTGDVFRGKFYFADTASTKLWVMDGALDNVDQNNQGGREVEWSFLTSFQGDPRSKRMHFVRPYFLGAIAPAFSVQARMDYNLSENREVVSLTPGQVAEWDSAVWDNAVWVGGIESSQALRGLSGVGHSVALAIRGESTVRNVFVSADVAYEQGWFL